MRWLLLSLLFLAACGRPCPDGQVAGPDGACHACDPASYGVALELRPFLDEAEWPDERVATVVAAELKKREPFVPADPLAKAGAASGGFPKNSLVLPGPDGASGEPGAWHLLSAESLLLDPLMTKAAIDKGEFPGVRITLDAEGKAPLTELTTASVGKRLAMVSRGRVQSTPVVREPITGGDLSVTTPDAESAVDLLCACLYAMASRDAGAPLR